MQAALNIFILLALSAIPVAAMGAPADDSPPVISPLVHEMLTIEFEPINEMSGLVRSRRFEDVYWIHNDSGDTARLFAVNGRGEVLFPSFMQRMYYGEKVEEGKQPWPGLAVEVAANLDWEDIAVDDEMIYIAEMGNNDNARRDLGVYVIPEPNPRSVGRTRSLKFVPVRYPDQEEFPAQQWRYDNEAMFVFNDKLYFLTKHRRRGEPMGWEPGTDLYRLNSMKTGEFNVLEKVDEHEQITLVTGADVSPDSKHLVVLCYTQLWVFKRPRRGDKWLSTDPRMIPLIFEQTGQVEAVAWQDNDTIVIGNEQSRLYTVELAEFPE